MLNTPRILDLDTLRLSAGAHEEDGEFCVMEAVAYVAGESWTDSPVCVSQVVASFLRTWNDQLGDDDRQKLKPLIPRLIGTATGSDVELRRAWMAVDWLCRTFTPRWLRAAALDGSSIAIEQLTGPIVDVASAEQILPHLRDAATAARAARAAAGAAAGDAAWAAAWAAAGDAAGAAAGAAARDAAGDAAGDAAWAAAGDAAWAAAGDAAGDAARAAAGDAARDAAGDAA